MIQFITGNENKFGEVKAVLGDVQQLDIDLPEIQELDAHLIIRAKLDEALKLGYTECFVEDTSLYLDCLDGLPGPLIKWFLKTLGNRGIFNLVDRYENYAAEAKTLIGYADVQGNVEFFEGSVRGTIVEPIATTNFGWDPLFKPEGHSKSFAEMSKEEKNGISMRRMALDRLKEHLVTNSTLDKFETYR